MKKIIILFFLSLLCVKVFSQCDLSLLVKKIGTNRTDFQKGWEKKRWEYSYTENQNDSKYDIYKSITPSSSLAVFFDNDGIINLIVMIYNEKIESYNAAKFILREEGWYESKIDMYTCENYSAEIVKDYPKIGQLSIAYKKYKIESVNTKVFFCGNSYGNHFHSTKICNEIKNCKEAIYSLESQSEALKKGYSHCSLCWD